MARTTKPIDVGGDVYSFKRKKEKLDYQYRSGCPSQPNKEKGLFFSLFLSLNEKQKQKQESIPDGTGIAPGAEGAPRIDKSKATSPIGSLETGGKPNKNINNLISLLD
jgi:hypothetical protein